MALTHRKPDPGLILHSDRGGQFHSHTYQEFLTQYGIRPSMGNAGSSTRGIPTAIILKQWGNNAAMESYFALLQKNILNLKKHWTSQAELATAIFYWTYHDYNRRRRQTGLHRHTPEEYETIHPSNNKVA